MSEQKITTHQHFISQLYLKRFSCQSGKVCVYDRWNNSVTAKAYKRFCCEDFLYETHWEKADEKLGEFVYINRIENLFQKYESIFGNLLKKIHSVCESACDSNMILNSSKDEENLYRFIANMIVRNPLMLQSLREDSMDDATNSRKNFANDLRDALDAIGIGGADSLMKATYLSVCLTEENGDGLVFDIIREFKKLNYCFYYSPNGSFVTSSCPPIVYEINSIYVYMPLSPFIVVALGKYPNSEKIHNKMIHANDEVVMKLNRLYLLADKKKIRYIIGNSKTVLNKLMSITEE